MLHTFHSFMNGRLQFEELGCCLQDLDEKPEENVDAEEAFKETDWVDVAEGYNSRQRKKVKPFAF